jgi:CRP-like cAMP-binding protein
VPILLNLSEQQLFQLARCMSNRSFEAGQAVFLRGDAGDTFFVVEEGSFRWGGAPGLRVGWV